MPRPTSMSIGARFVRSRLALLVGAAVALFLLVGFAREVLNRRAVNEEIRSLEAQIAQLEDRKQELTSFLQTLTSPLYQEQEAREKLGLSKPGEHVVIVPLEQDTTSGASQGTQPDAPNPVKWWRYFFAS